MADPNTHLSTALADRYHIERELGAGGMATVYLAHDLKHDRKVAIKVLRPELAAVIGGERFLAEIKTTAHLQHPHILSLFDSGEINGTVFYVMPYVSGESLRDRLAREKQLPIADAISITREVADALQSAHDQQVIHRDIKPENILLQGGHALVADFGIALAASRTGGTRMTETGMSLGTPQYMSPEQAMGERELDARTDLYALGCVAYEMLTGEPPFTGPTAQAIVAKVMTEPAPDIRRKRPTVPDHVDNAIRMAMQKLPADRFRNAAEFAAALATAPPVAARGRSIPLQRRRPALGTMLLAAAAISAASFFAGVRMPVTHRDAPATLGRARHVTWEPGLEITPALSPDGKSVAYAAGPMSNMHIVVRPVSEGRIIQLTSDTSDAESAPRWSPDGTRVLFLSRNGVFSAPAGGGPAKPEVPAVAGTRVLSAAWAPDGKRLLFTRGDSIFVREQDASVRGIAHLAEPTMCQWSPQETFIACATGTMLYATAGQAFGNISPGRIMLVRVRDGAVTTATDTLTLNTSPAWSSDGRWLYFISDRDGPRDIYGTALTTDGRADGKPVRLSAGLGAHSISVSAGTLAYSLYTRRSTIWSIATPAHPPMLTTTATRLTNSNEYIEVFTVSHDGKWLYYDSDLTGNSDIFRISVAGGEPQQLTNDPADDFAPAGSPDGTEFSFHSWRSGSRDVYVQRLDGSGVTAITKSPRQEALGVWSPDGRTISLTEFTAHGGIWLVHRNTDGSWAAPILRRSQGSLTSFSPDGRQLAFLSSLLGSSLYIMPTDSGEAHLLIDGDLPGNPVPESVIWGSDGLIYFQTQDAHGKTSIWSIAPAGGAPRMLLEFDPAVHHSYRMIFDVRGGRFYFATEDRQSDIWTMALDPR